MGIKHGFVSTKPESPDPTVVGASSWNDDHVIDVVAPIGLTGATAPSRYAGGTTAGAPTVGSFLVGDYVVAQDGRLFICTSPGSPGTWAAGATMWHTGVSLPDDAVGVDGDLYLCTATGGVYLRAGGTWY